MGKAIEGGKIEHVVDGDAKEVQELVVDDDGKEAELRFLVRGVAVEDPKLYDRNKYRDLYKRYDYYEVDLNRFESGHVLVPCCDPLMSSLGATGTVCIGSKIFTVGYLFTPLHNILDSVEYMGESVDCLKCVAFVDLSHDHPRKWKQVSPPIEYGLGYECAALGGRLYCLQSEYLGEPLVYVPEDDKWSIFSGAIPPTQYHESTISPKIIPHPTHDRILLHLCGDNILDGLYAWYPNCSHVVAAPSCPSHSVKSTDSPRNTLSTESTDSPHNTHSVESTDSPRNTHSVESSDSPRNTHSIESSDSPRNTHSVESSDSPPNHCSVESSDSPPNHRCTKSTDSSPNPCSMESPDSPPDPHSVECTDSPPDPNNLESTDFPPDHHHVYPSYPHHAYPPTPNNVKSTDSSNEFPDNLTHSPLSPSLKCVRSDVTSRTWGKKTTLAQGMLFFFSRKYIGLVKVLDLQTNKWIRVEWPSPPPALSHIPKVNSMFYLGNGYLCLAINGYCTTPCFGTRIYLYLFHFHRSDDSTVVISHRFTKYFDAHGLRYAEDFVPLGDVCW